MSYHDIPGRNKTILGGKPIFSTCQTSTKLQGERIETWFLLVQAERTKINNEVKPMNIL